MFFENGDRQYQPNAEIEYLSIYLSIYLSMYLLIIFNAKQIVSSYLVAS